MDSRSRTRNVMMYRGSIFLIILLAIFYAWVLSFGISPKISDCYRKIYIDHTLKESLENCLNPNNVQVVMPLSEILSITEKRPYRMIMAVEDEATAGLSEKTKSWLTTKQSCLGKLAYRGSYVGLWENAKPVAERCSNTGSVSLKLPLRETTSLRLESAGMVLQPSYSHIWVNETDLSQHLRGINFVLLDKNLQAALIGHIDTHRSEKVGKSIYTIITHDAQQP